jgi:glycosyltransferase involved in cell wall biosynthesis
MLSLIVPIYKSEENIEDLLLAVSQLRQSIKDDFEAVFVVDGSPDRSAELLNAELPRQSFKSHLLILSRNFGSFAAIKAGLTHAHGNYFAVMAADLQEPPSLVVDFYKSLSSGEYDIVVGSRESREDPWLTRLSSGLFWSIYRRLIQRSMPRNGVDIFGCNLRFRNELINLNESNSSLVGLVFWLGFRRKEIAYKRLKRTHGKSAWTFKKKLKYLSDSIFAFSDLPIQLLLVLGCVGILLSVLVGSVVLLAKLLGLISVPGYAATVLLILFFAGLNSLGLGLIGSYVWRAFENTKHRPNSVVMSSLSYQGAINV